MKILIVDDDRQQRIFLKSNLEKNGFIIDIAENGQLAINFISINTYDLILLDLNLPDISGSDIAVKLRNENNNVPIIIISGEGEVTTKTSLLDFGADDYITKPFSLDELIARIKAVSRRPGNIQQLIYKIKDLEIDLQKQTVKKLNKFIYLTRKEFLILEYLLKNKNRIVSKIDLLENVWDSEVDLFSKSIETHILNLRKKINNQNRTYLIKTIPGRGYQI